MGRPAEVITMEVVEKKTKLYYNTASSKGLFSTTELNKKSQWFKISIPSGYKNKKIEVYDMIGERILYTAIEENYQKLFKDYLSFLENSLEELDE